jgi:hypothetical protein
VVDGRCEGADGDPLLHGGSVAHEVTYGVTDSVTSTGAMMNMNDMMII